MAGVSLSTPRARFAWQAWYFLYLHRCQRKLGDSLGLIDTAASFRGRRVTFSTSGSMCVVCLQFHVCMYVCMHACMYGWMDGCMYLCPQCCSQLIALQACSFCTPVFQIVSETHSNITSNSDKIQGKHVHNHFLALSFTTSSPFPLSFPLFLHIPFLNFAFHLNSVSEGNWEHVGLSGPIILAIAYIPFNEVYGVRLRLPMKEV